jgi:hypothetical protein
MHIDTYRSSRYSLQFLSVPSRTDPASINLPTGTDFGTWQPFRQNEEIIAGEHHIAFDAADVIRQIQARGFALHAVEIRTEVTEVHLPRRPSP